MSSDVRLTRRSLFTAAVGTAGLFLLSEPVIAAPEPEIARQRFWPGWRRPGTVERDAFPSITLSDPTAARLTSAQLEAELEALWREVSRPQPWDLLYVETDRIAHQGDLGVWTGVAFIPIGEMRRDGSIPGQRATQLPPGRIIQVTPQQIAEWTH